MIKKICYNNEIVAIIIKSNFRKDGIEFFTPEEYTLQLGYMNRPSGYVIPPHLHNTVSREVVKTQEVLFLKSGKIRVDFYDNNQKYLESDILEKGDVIFLASGGHGFIVLEDTELIEVKQGPYCGEKDKIRFNHNIMIK